MTERIDAAITAWKSSAKRLAWLGSGTWVEVLLPSAIDLASRGLLDPSIRGMALRFATTGVDLEKLDEDELAAFDLMRRTVIATMVRAVTAGAVDEDPARPGYPLDYPHCMVPISLTPADLHDLGPDAGQLTALADRAVTPETVTLRTRAARAAIASIANVDEPETPSQGEAVDDVARFRP